MATKKKAKSPNIPASTPQTSQVTASQAKQRKSVKQRKQQRSQMYLILAAVVVVIVVGALILINNRTQAQVAAPPVLASGLPAEMINRNVKGSPDAKVVVTEFADFECPACQTYSQGTGKMLEEEYVKTGLVRFEYKHMPLPQHEPSATNAAWASECAADQGKFWEMHDYLFQEQGKQGQGSTFTQIRLKAMAQELGLDVNQFDKCLSTQQHAQTVQDDVAEARQLRVNSTPTLYVNGQRVANPSVTDMRAAIDAALAAQGVQKP
ncbi:MAG: DsbA family protein [Anaerolinea sp.]|nr:DsbA family protein [Anaerolinea sp.]